MKLTHKKISDKYKDDNVMSFNWRELCELDYDDILESLGVSIIVGSYQMYHGFNLINMWLVKAPDGEIGHVNFNFGTCSTCDMLMGCNTLTDLDNLQSTMHSSIQWIGYDAAIVKDWIVSRNWTIEKVWHGGSVDHWIKYVIDHINTEGLYNDKQ